MLQWEVKIVLDLLYKSKEYKETDLKLEFLISKHVVHKVIKYKIYNSQSIALII